MVMKKTERLDKKAIRLAGGRMTSQREILLDLIERTDKHLDANELHRLAQHKDKRISLSTVYRTLNLLKRMNLVDELHFDEDHHHYEAKALKEHYHLVCLNCGTVVEFSSPLIDSLKESVAKDENFQITNMRIDIAGYCSKCPEES